MAAAQRGGRQEGERDSLERQEPRRCCVDDDVYTIAAGCLDRSTRCMTLFFAWFIDCSGRVEWLLSGRMIGIPTPSPNKMVGQAKTANRAWPSRFACYLSFGRIMHSHKRKQRKNISIIPLERTSRAPSIATCTYHLPPCIFIFLKPGTHIPLFLFFFPLSTLSFPFFFLFSFRTNHLVRL